MPAANAAAPVKKNSNFQAIVKRLFQNRGAVIGLIIFIVLALAAIFAPVAAPYGYEEMDLTNMLSGPRDRKSTRLNSSHKTESRMPSSA